ncbi:MAG: hypothetical protein ABSG05_01455 [Candidatus Pacearchaeota archaeon]|jgi:hypothetical protein
MVKIALTPDWFLGKDLIIDIFSFVVLALFTFFAYKYYKMSKNKGTANLGKGFGFIALAELADIATKLVLFYHVGPSRAIGEALITNNIISSVDIFYYAGFFFFRFFMLLGLYFIYRLPKNQKRSLEDYILMFYFILISAFIGQEFFYIFHITAFLLLVLIIESYIKIYKENKFLNTKILIIGFSILALSQMLFIFSNIALFYAIADVVELISYIIFLGLIIRIWKHGKEKKSNGNNIRHAGNSARKRRKH